MFYGRSMSQKSPISAITYIKEPSILPYMKTPVHYLLHPIADGDLGLHIMQLLVKIGVDTVEDVVDYSREDLRSQTGHYDAIAEIERILQETYSLHLAETPLRNRVVDQESRIIAYGRRVTLREDQHNDETRRNMMAVYLHAIQRKTVEKIAEETNVPIGQVTDYLKQAGLQVFRLI